VHDLLVDPARRRHRAIAIERCAEQPLHHAVHDDDARAGVEGAHPWVGTRRGGWHDGHVANAADVLQCPPRHLMRKQQHIGHRDEGRPLSAHGHIARPKIGDHGAAGALGNARRIADLPRAMTRFVPQRLSVRRHRAHIGGGNTGATHGLARGVAKPLAKVGVQATHVTRRATLHGRRQPLPFLYGVVPLHEVQQRGLRTTRRAVGKRHDGGTDAVE